MEFDVGVVGLGAMGSAACAHLAARGVRVAGFEQFELGHERGSSAGQTRIIRKAYFEHASYVPLLERSYALWRELEKRSREQLLDLFGVLVAGREDSLSVRGAERASQRYRIPIERFDAAGLRARFPRIRFRDDESGIFEPEAGVVFPERGIAAHLACASKDGAVLRDRARVARIERARGETIVTLADGERVRCGKAIVTAGPWTTALLAGVALPLRVERNVQFWFAPEPGTCAPAELPAYFVERAGWHAPVYGVPDLGGGVKFACHGSGDDADPDTLDRLVGDDETSRARGALAQLIPSAAGGPIAAKACMYTMTPDGHFAIGPHPADPHVIVLCGFSGHGYKFAPAIGELAARMVLELPPEFDLEFLALRRLNVSGVRGCT